MQAKLTCTHICIPATTIYIEKCTHAAHIITCYYWQVGASQPTLHVLVQRLIYAIHVHITNLCMCNNYIMGAKDTSDTVSVIL